jgi:hypothetical protein
MTPKVVFKFDKEKDLWNIWDTANFKTIYGYDQKKGLSEDVLKICQNKKYEECKKELMKNMEGMYKNNLIKITAKQVNEIWKSIEIEYFKRLEKITKRKFKFKRVKGFLTTCGRCPYKPHWRPPAFYVGFFANIPKMLNTAGHELMHIHLHNTDWWKKVEKELGNDKTHHLKEALTVLLNLEFRDLWFGFDPGFPRHIKLRQFIEKEWRKKKDFDKLTDKCIKWIKKNGVK